MTTLHITFRHQPRTNLVSIILLARREARVQKRKGNAYGRNVFLSIAVEARRALAEQARRGAIRVGDTQIAADEADRFGDVLHGRAFHRGAA